MPLTFDLGRDDVDYQGERLAQKVQESHKEGTIESQLLKKV
jgi:hypothetical protein